MAAVETISQQLASYACALTYGDLPEAHVQKMKLHFLDWMGCVYAGFKERPIQILLEELLTLGGHGEATIIPTGHRTTALSAAMLNSASSCLMEMDDLHRESIFHPASVVIPAVLASGERNHASGKELILAMVVGYEIGIRVALGVGLSHYAYWHPTATCGTFAAAAGTAKLLDLEPDRLTWALGSAGTQAAGLWAFLVESAMSKPLHIGKAASNGLLAASLAARGLTGAKGILEGEKGFFRATSQDHDVGKCIADLGRNILYEQTALKLHASCGHTHPAIDAALRATGGSRLEAGEIEQVDVFIYQTALDLLEGVEPITPTQAKFNLPFCVATAIVYGQVALEDFETARLSDSNLIHVIERTSLHSASEFTQAYPKKWSARVKISTRQGRQLEAHCENPRGGLDNPLTEDEILQKFRTLAAGELRPDGANQIAERILELEKIGDVNELFVP